MMPKIRLLPGVSSVIAGEAIHLGATKRWALLAMTRARQFFYAETPLCPMT
jgi:hypothetical protein